MLSVITKLAGRRERCLLVVALAVGATWASAPSALALAAPEWGVTVTHANPYGQHAGECPSKKPETETPCGINPFTEAKGEEGVGGEGKTFARESGSNTYTITVKNTGTAASKGAVTVIDRLPAGMLLLAQKASGEAGGTGWSGGGEANACKIETTNVVAYPTKVECSTQAALEVGNSYPPITLHVSVTPQAADSLTDVASVSGGEAPETKAEDETKITKAVPFGFSNFTTRIFECELEQSCEKPSTQAGGHPFAVSNLLTLNLTTSAYPSQSGTELLVPAGGPAKELQVALPPGFLGNPQNLPQCPIALLAHGNCPNNTAVGFTKNALTVSTGVEIKGGRPTLFPTPPNPEYTGRVYNLEPAAGHPAEFGFCFLNCVPLILDAKLRSGTDYGVTVGDTAVGAHPLAVEVTFCENGVEGVRPNLHCVPAKANTKPLLTNPTSCSNKEPQVWTGLASPWFEPATLAETPAFVGLTGLESPESFLTGCEKLKFHPQAEFKPSPPSEGGTSQAGEPTAMTFALKNPQANEASSLATPALKNLAFALPAGMTLSASAADGLEACTKAEFWPPENGAEPAEHREPAVPAKCPLASQIGTLEIYTPLLIAAPTINGGAQYDQHSGKVLRAGTALTCSQGMWVGSPTLSYQFLREGEKIMTSGASGSVFPAVYTATEADVGKAIQCQVTGTDAGGASVAVSRNATGPFATGPEKSPPEPPFPPLSVPAPSGTASAGNTLSCEHGAWTSESEPTFTYAWLRNGESIGGGYSGSNQYTLTPQDQGKAIQCQVKGTNVKGAHEEAGSPPLTRSAIADSAPVVVSPEPNTPPALPGAATQGHLYVGQPECSPCTNADAEDGKLLPLFIEVQDPSAGIIVKLHGSTRLNTQTGQATTFFEDQPQVPFESLLLKLKGGERGVLANPTVCGTSHSRIELTPWSAPTPVSLETPLEVTGCGPPQFAPTFNAGTTNNQAGAFSPLSLTFSRTDKDQDFEALTVHTPPGVAGMISNVALCEEAQANAGTCSPASQIGTTEVGSGPGPHPFYLKGKVYLTGPYKGQPFGMSVAVPAIAGPFNLGMVVVRSSIHVDPYTAAITVTSDPFPKILDGIPTHIKQVNVNINREHFIFNPTNCSPQQISATLTSLQGASAQVSSPLGIGGCTSLPFSPTLTASTQADTSKANGASLDVKVTSGTGQANIGKTTLILPRSLPSRLTTIQKACVAAVFNANPAACPAGSVVGTATAHTPVLKNPLTGPAFLVSHGGAAFPDVEFVLQGEGITLDLDGQTNIKNGVTSSTFDALPDAPVSTFETLLPEGPHSALAALGNLCTQSLEMPTTITGQNGAVITQVTHIAVTGCPPTVAIVSTKLTGNTLLVTVRTSATGTVWISGYGLKTTKNNLKAGTHQFRVAFTKTGTSMRKHHKKTSVRVKLIVGKQAVAQATNVRL